MKIYTITDIKSNICEVETHAFLDYEKALSLFNDLYKDHKEYFNEIFKNEEEDLDYEEYLAEKWDEYTSPEHKHFSYYNGEYYTSVDLETHEVE